MRDVAPLPIIQRLHQSQTPPENLERIQPLDPLLAVLDHWPLPFKANVTYIYAKVL
jgi:hypothetical protein